MPRADWPTLADGDFEAGVKAKRPRCALAVAAYEAGTDKFLVVVSDEESDWLHVVLGAGGSPLDAWVDAWEFCA